MADARIRQIKIKAGVVKRTAKEKSMYEKEAKKEEEKVQKMKDEGKDEHDVKKQAEVAQESFSMISDTKRRLGNALSDLKAVLEKEEDLKECEEYKLAQEAIDDGQKVYDS